MTTEEAPRELRTTFEMGGMGHSVKRKEDPRFIRGQGEYIDDVNLPGQLWLDIVRSPYAHARIKSIDASEALKIPGVLAVIDGKALETYKLHWMPTLAGDMQMVLPTDTVMYQAQEVAAVIATTKYIAADGVAAVLVDYEPLPVVTDPFKALEADAPVLRPDRGEGKQTNHIWHWELGDREATDADLAAADVHIEQDIYIPRIHVASIETCGCVADWNPVRQQLTLHMTTQAPHAIRTVIALVAAGAGLPISEQNIRVKTHDIGGGFGGKVPVYPGYVLAVAASFLIGKPVKWIEDRSENLQADSFARDYHIHAEIGATKDGKITSLKAKTIADHGYTDAAADPSKYPAGLFNVITGSYDFPNAFVEVDGVYTNKPPGGVAYRCSFRVTEAVHAVERMVDILAHQIGKDPAQLRMENFIQPEQFPYKTPTGWSYDSGNYPAALQKALDMIGYDDLRKEQVEKRARGELMGIGISSFTEIVGAGPSHDFDILGIKMFDSCEIRVHPTGKVIARLGVQSQGQGHETTFAQIIAEELGFPVADIKIEEGDTDTAPYGLGTYASRSTPVAGAATAVAARKIRDKARKLAAHLLEASEEDLEVGARQVQRQGQPRPVQDHPGDRVRGLHQPSRRDGGGARSRRLLRPAEFHVPIRQLHLRRRHRQGDRPGQRAPVRGHRRLRQHHQPDDRGRPDPRRPDDGPRPVALRADHLRRAGQQHGRHVHGLPAPDRGGDARLGDRQDRHAVAASSDRRQGRGRIGHGRRSAGHRQCRRGCPLASGRAQHRYPHHAAEGLGDPARGGHLLTTRNGPVPTGAGQEDESRATRRSPGPPRLEAAGRSFAVATVVAVRRPTSARPGRAASSIRRHDRGLGRRRCAQPVVVREAMRAIADGQPRLLRLSKDGPGEGRRADGVIELVMTCHSGGTLEIYVEPHLPAPLLWVIGTTPIAGALVSLGAAMGWKVTVVDPIADADAFPAADRVHASADIRSWIPRRRRTSSWRARGSGTRRPSGSR